MSGSRASSACLVGGGPTSRLRCERDGGRDQWFHPTSRSAQLVSRTSDPGTSSCQRSIIIQRAAAAGKRQWEFGHAGRPTPRPPRPDLENQLGREAKRLRVLALGSLPVASPTSPRIHVPPGTDAFVFDGPLSSSSCYIHIPAHPTPTMPVPRSLPAPTPIWTAPSTAPPHFSLTPTPPPPDHLPTQIATPRTSPTAHSSHSGSTPPWADQPNTPTEAVMLPPASMQFSGTFQGVTWNTQALFARKSGRQSAKRRHALKLMQSNDFAGWQETHSTNGATRALKLPAEVHHFWSHDSAKQGGVGLWVKETFLSNFNPTADEGWEEIEAGRVAVLHLRGWHGHFRDISSHRQ